MLRKRVTCVAALILALPLIAVPVQGQTISGGVGLQFVYTADLVANVAGGIELRWRS